MEDENRSGYFHWNELLTTDVELAKRFFTTLLGWSYEDMAMPDGSKYFVALLDDEPVAGLMTMPKAIPAGTPPHWLSYIEVDDLDVRLGKARQGGGSVLREPFEVEGVGRIAIIADPTGAVLGLIAPAAFEDD